MSGAMARNPKLAKHGSWSRQLSESSGQPCTNIIGGAPAGPQERENVVCRGDFATCSGRGNFPGMESSLLMRGAQWGPAHNEARRTMGPGSPQARLTKGKCDALSPVRQRETS